LNVEKLESKDKIAENLKHNTMKRLKKGDKVVMHTCYESIMPQFIVSKSYSL
jgi:hypothetical protein